MKETNNRVPSWTFFFLYEGKNKEKQENRGITLFCIQRKQGDQLWLRKGRDSKTTVHFVPKTENRLSVEDCGLFVSSENNCTPTFNTLHCVEVAYVSNRGSLELGIMKGAIQHSNKKGKLDSDQKAPSFCLRCFLLLLFLAEFAKLLRHTQVWSRRPYRDIQWTRWHSGMFGTHIQDICMCTHYYLGLLIKYSLHEGRQFCRVPFSNWTLHLSLGYRFYSKILTTWTHEVPGFIFPTGLCTSRLNIDYLNTWSTRVHYSNWTLHLSLGYRYIDYLNTWSTRVHFSNWTLHLTPGYRFYSNILITLTTCSFLDTCSRVQEG